MSDRIVRQSLFAKALDVFRFYNGTCDLGDFNPDDAALKLTQDPVEFCRSLNPFSEEPRVITWQWDKDIRREVMIPPEHFLLVRSPYPFRAKIIAGQPSTTLAHEIALPCSDGTFFALFSPQPVPEEHYSCSLKLSVFQETGDQEKLSFSKKLSFLSKQTTAPLLYLSHHENMVIEKGFYRSELLQRHHLFLATNGHGAMLRAHVSWGELHSRYDALLAANLNPDYPEDRRIMFTRCRAWIVYQGYSSEIKNDSLHTFHTDENNCGIWEYQPLTGQGEHISLIIQMEMIPGKNAVNIRFIRGQRLSFSKKLNLLSQLDDDREVRLILRPDIEDRNFHETTKAYSGPEHHWKNAVNPHPEGFTFVPDVNRQLNIQISKGNFVWEPEWHYMINHDSDGERGLDPNSDLFSPGYFSAYLKGGDIVELTAEVRTVGATPCGCPSPPCVNKAVGANNYSPLPIPIPVLDHFIVKREKLSTVIAGYPWFLDWGRDTLIFVRGLIAVGRLQESRAILKQFARFEKDGTLPNMIRGNDAGNRDTSDAPLWFFAACADLIEAEQKLVPTLQRGNESFLDEICGDRTLREILISMGNSLIKGTPNGIRMDPESCLLFSPSHYTWMDTNFPAGTPREGYPIEIQALWYKTLRVLETIRVSDKTLMVLKESILKYFFLDSEGYLSDCLHCRPGQSAKDAKPDDALRPNQLFAITMGAVTDKAVCRKILSACEELLVPGAIRTLADRPVKYPVEIIHQGVIHNPYHPYHGIYTGDEDTRRKPAYHNGTAWTWVFPSFCEAWVKVYGEKSKQTALALLSSSSRIINEGCVGHIPEILDGDSPHTQRGCDAQAWGVSEWLRVWMRISS